MKTSSAPAAAVGACSLLLGLQLAGSMAAHAADATADTNAADAATATTGQGSSSSGSSDQLSEVVVTGIRADLEKALNIKE